MDLKDFRSGVFRQEYQYKSFLPSKINHTFTWHDPEINILLEQATRLLSELDAFTLIVPNVDIFIGMHIVKEANTSSKIEGTKTEIDDILLEKEYINPEKREDWQEVRNYINAMEYEIDELDNLPIGNRLIKKIHKILLDSVRGEKKQPGEYRNSQNWIGGKDINTATFIPPNHVEINELMGDLELFIHNQKVMVPHLIKIAIIHYQFETIHPFLDGNGRVGRLLITLYLVSNNILRKPSLYLSNFIEKNKDEYYKALMIPRKKHDISYWIKFFLKAVIATAKDSIGTFKKIFSLTEKMNSVIPMYGRRANNVKKLIDYMYQYPIFSSNEITKELGISKPTANTLLKDLENSGIIKEVTGFQRNKLFIFVEYMKIYNEH
jgi:Fic family protein